MANDQRSVGKPWHVGMFSCGFLKIAFNSMTAGKKKNTFRKVVLLQNKGFWTGVCSHILTVTTQI